MSSFLRRSLIAAIVLTAVVLAIGLWQSVFDRFRPWALAAGVTGFVPLIVAHFYMRKEFAFVARIWVAAGNLALAAMYFWSALSAYQFTGLLYPPAVVYPILLVALFTLVALLVIAQRPNSSSKPTPLRGAA